MYTNGKPKGVVKDFIDFILSEEGQELVETAGYVGLK
jgi:phosphate transport system substrate-binding protein